MSAVRYVAIGDSFTEGVGDRPDGGVERGWADLTAQGWANALGEPIQYANLAIRGRLAWPVVREQLEPALALRPTHLSFNAGGNDVLRPRADPERIADAFSCVLRRCEEEGVTMIALSGANPSRHLPLHHVIQRRGDALSEAVSARFAQRPDTVTAWNWPDPELASPRYWAQDRLHLNAAGHHRVAAREIDAIGLQPAEEWWHLPSDADSPQIGTLRYWRRYVAPWVSRRITRRSSGDGRTAKIGDWIDVPPEG